MGKGHIIIIIIVVWIGSSFLSAALKLTRSSWVRPEERVVLLNTGTGLKYPETVHTEPPLLQPEDRLPGI